MNTTNVLNKDWQGYPNDVIADFASLAVAETDDLKGFPVLLTSGDVSDLIKAAMVLQLAAETQNFDRPRRCRGRQA